MSQAKVAKTQAEFDTEAILDYEREHDGAFKMEQLADKLLAEGWEVRVPSKRAVLTKRLKRAAREIHETDKQKRRVRSIIAAKFTRTGPDGKPKTEVEYDHIHGMTWDHAITAFKQRCDNQQRQDSALGRDIASFNDNNPNAKEHKITKQMLLSFDGGAEQLVETIRESDEAKRKKRTRRKPR